MFGDSPYCQDIRGFLTQGGPPDDGEANLETN